MINFITQLLVRGVWFTFGVTALWFANNAFDWVLYPVMMCKMGLIAGGIMMTMLSVLFNLILIEAYDALGKDLFALEAAKAAQSANVTWWGNLLGRSRWLTFVILSVYDPVPAVIYIRGGHSQFSGLMGRDWLMFVLATLISNGAWIVLMAAGLTAVESFEHEVAVVLTTLGVNPSVIGSCVPLL